MSLRPPLERMTDPARVSGAWRLAAALLLIVATISIESCAPMRHDGAGSSMMPSPADPPEEAAPIAAAAASEASPAAEPDLFVSSVRPVLSRRCTPCHEPGGKMYGSMPFDNPQTISSHSEGISRRLKGEDLEALKRWLESLPAKEKT